MTVEIRYLEGPDRVRGPFLAVAPCQKVQHTTTVGFFSSCNDWGPGTRVQILVHAFRALSFLPPLVPEWKKNLN